MPISPSTLSFLQNNWAQILVLLVSGGMLLWPLVGKRFSTVKEVGTLQATRLINSENAVLLDLREAKEYEGGRLPNATHIPLSQLAGRGTELRKFSGRPIIAYCDRGNRSRLAKGALGKLGFDQIYTLKGGIRAWREAGLPVEKT